MSPERLSALFFEDIDAMNMVSQDKFVLLGLL